MKKFYDNYQDPQGDAIEGAFVTVLNPNGSLASLFASNSTTTPLANPVKTDALGYYWFYVEDGRYNIQFHKDGYVDLTLTDVEIADQDDASLLDARILAALQRLNLTQVVGPPGKGLPPGGTAGQIAKKLSNTDYDVTWGDQSVASGFRPEVDLVPVSGVATMNNADSNNFLMDMTTDVVIANPIGYSAGDRIRLIFQQDANGSHAISFGSKFQYSGNTTPTFSKAAGAIYRLDLDLIKGDKWVITPFIIQYNGDSTNIPPQTGTSSGQLITSYPWDGTVVPDTATVTLDATTKAAYDTAKANAALGSKRAAVLAAIRTAFGTTQMLTLTRNGTTVLTANYSGQLTNLTQGSELGLGLSTIQDVSVIAPADIDTGTWIAVLSNDTRTMTMSAGAVGSGKTMEISQDTVAGLGIIFTMNVFAPRSIDGLL